MFELYYKIIYTHTHTHTHTHILRIWVLHRLMHGYV